MPHRVEPLLDSPTTVGGMHRLTSMPRRRGACRPPPHCVEPILYSPTTVGGAHQQAVTGLPAAATPCGAVPRLAHDGGRHAPANVCRPPPHREEPFLDSPVTVGGTHRQDAHGRAALPSAIPRPNCTHNTTVESLQNESEEESGHATPPPARPWPNCMPHSIAGPSPLHQQRPPKSPLATVAGSGTCYRRC
jgi:hypothetical protein